MAEQTSMSAAAAASRKVFDAWAAGVETTLKATFEAENAALEAGLSVLDAAAAVDRTAFQEWATAARKAQEAALEAFRANTRAAGQMGDTSKR
jgi:hypothetical protein